MNAEKLKQLQEQVRIGGKGTQRRKKKVVHRATATDDKKLQGTLKKLGVNVIPGIEEVNLFKDDGNVIHFNNPKVQASLTANTFAITGHAETKTMPEMFPSILSHLGLEHLSNLRKYTSGLTDHDETGPNGDTSDKAALHEEEDEVPDLVENFDEASKAEVV